MCCAENSNSCCTAFPIRRRLWQALTCDVARGSKTQRSQNHPRNTRFQCRFVPIFSAIFGLILTHVLKTEWSVAAAGVALRPAAMQIAHRSGVFLYWVPAPHQAVGRYMAKRRSIISKTFRNGCAVRKTPIDQLAYIKSGLPARSVNIYALQNARELCYQWRIGENDARTLAYEVAPAAKPPQTTPLYLGTRVDTRG